MRFVAGVFGATISCVTLGAFVWVIWHTYAATPAAADLRPVPVVRADKGPIKTRPSRRGGLKVPHQDIRIYDRIAKPGGGPESKRRFGMKNAASVERLIPVTAPGMVQHKPVTLAERRISGGRARAIAYAGVTTGKRGTGSSRRRPVRVGHVASLGEYRIQIGVYDEAQTAARRWYSLYVRHRDLIEGLDWFVEKVERGDDLRPIYRLQLGPLYDGRAAQRLCAQLARRDVGCRFVKG